MANAPKTSLRLERINSEILHEVRQYIVTQLDDPILKQAQFDRVETSKDLSQTKLYFTIADPNISKKQLTLHLNGIANRLRHHLATVMNLRMTPQIKFYYDEQVEKTNRLLKVLAELE